MTKTFCDSCGNEMPLSTSDELSDKTSISVRSTEGVGLATITYEITWKRVGIEHACLKCVLESIFKNAMEPRT